MPRPPFHASMTFFFVLLGSLFGLVSCFQTAGLEFVTEEMVVASQSTPNYTLRPTVHLLADGRFLVGYERHGFVSSESSVAYQLWDASGTTRVVDESLGSPVGMTQNQVYGGSVAFPQDIGMSALAGGFGTLYEAKNHPAPTQDDNGFYLQTFNASLSAMNESRVNSATPERQGLVVTGDSCLDGKRFMFLVRRRAVTVENPVSGETILVVTYLHCGGDVPQVLLRGFSLDAPVPGSPAAPSEAWSELSVATTSLAGMMSPFRDGSDRVAVVWHSFPNGLGESQGVYAAAVNVRILNGASGTWNSSGVVVRHYLDVRAVYPDDRDVYAASVSVISSRFVAVGVMESYEVHDSDPRFSIVRIFMYEITDESSNITLVANCNGVLLYPALPTKLTFGKASFQRLADNVFSVLYSPLAFHDDAQDVNGGKIVGAIVRFLPETGECVVIEPSFHIGRICNHAPAYAWDTKVNHATLAVNRGRAFIVYGADSLGVAFKARTLQLPWGPPVLTSARIPIVVPACCIDGPILVRDNLKLFYENQSRIDELILTLSDVSDVRFEKTSNPGVEISEFTHFEVDQGLIQMTYVGNSTPTATVTICDPAANVSSDPEERQNALSFPFVLSFVVDYDDVTFVQRHVVAEEGLEAAIDLTMINATRALRPERHALIRLELDNVVNGIFLLSGSPTTNFTIQNIVDGIVSFRHSASGGVPGANITAVDPTDSMRSLKKTLNFSVVLDQVFITSTSAIDIHEGEEVVLTPTEVLPTRPLRTANENDLLVVVTSVQYGWFRLNRNVKVTTFSRRQIVAGDISFQHNDSEAEPSCRWFAFDPSDDRNSSEVACSFTYHPVDLTLTTNDLVVADGRDVVLTTSMLDVSYPYHDVAAVTIHLIVDRMKAVVDGVNLTDFTMRQVVDSEVRLVYDGEVSSGTAPSCNMSASSGTDSTQVVPCTIDFSCVPLVVTNRLYIEASSVAVTKEVLWSTDCDTNEGDLEYRVLDVTNGLFAAAAEAPDTPITTFLQADFDSRNLTFTLSAGKTWKDASCSLEVTDGRWIVQFTCNFLGPKTKIEEEGDSTVVVAVSVAMALLVIIAVVVIIVVVVLCVVLRKRGKVEQPDGVAQALDEDGLKAFASLEVDAKLFEVDYDDIKIEQSIGSGGSNSTVFRALYDGDTIAFKCFHLSAFLGEDRFTEFEREVRVLGSVTHPRILKFFGATLHPPRVGILMEFCPNGDLLDFMAKVEVLPDVRLRLLGETAAAMSYLHKRDIFHRDLKPENVFVTEDVSARLADFGLSRLIQEFDSAKTRMVGTSFYMAPEVVRGGDYSVKVDVFSFGIMMFVVVSGNPTPYGVSPIGVEHKVATDPTFRPTVDEDSEEFKGIPWAVSLMKDCWNHQADKRPSFKDIVGTFAANKLGTQATSVSGKKKDDEDDKKIDEDHPRPDARVDPDEDHQSDSDSREEGSEDGDSSSSSSSSSGTETDD